MTSWLVKSRWSAQPLPPFPRTLCPLLIRVSDFNWLNPARPLVIPRSSSFHHPPAVLNTAIPHPLYNTAIVIVASAHLDALSARQWLVADVIKHVNKAVALTRQEQPLASVQTDSLHCHSTLFLYIQTKTTEWVPSRIGEVREKRVLGDLHIAQPRNFKLQKTRFHLKESHI